MNKWYVKQSVILEVFRHRLLERQKPIAAMGINGNPSQPQSLENKFDEYFVLLILIFYVIKKIILTPRAWHPMTSLNI